MGSGALGQRVGGRPALAPGSYQNGQSRRLNYSETGDSLIEQRPHCTDVFTPVSISHFTPGLLPDRICSGTSFYPRFTITSHQSKEGIVRYLSPPYHPQHLLPSLVCCHPSSNSMVLLQINNQYCISVSAEASRR